MNLILGGCGSSHGILGGVQIGSAEMGGATSGTLLAPISYTPLWVFVTPFLRGDLIIKKRENFGLCLKFKFGLLTTDGGGLNFSKKSKFQIFGPYGTLGAT